MPRFIAQIHVSKHTGDTNVNFTVTAQTTADSKSEAAQKVAAIINSTRWADIEVYEDDTFPAVRA